MLPWLREALDCLEVPTGGGGIVIAGGGWSGAILGGGMLGGSRGGGGKENGPKAQPSVILFTLLSSVGGCGCSRTALESLLSSLFLRLFFIFSSIICLTLLLLSVVAFFFLFNCSKTCLAFSDVSTTVMSSSTARSVTTCPPSALVAGPGPAMPGGVRWGTI
jgi:hypothetical protein